MSLFLLHDKYFFFYFASEVTSSRKLIIAFSKRSNSKFNGGVQQLPCVYLQPIWQHFRVSWLKRNWKRNIRITGSLQYFQPHNNKKNQYMEKSTHIICWFCRILECSIRRQWSSISRSIGSWCNAWMGIGQVWLRKCMGISLGVQLQRVLLPSLNCFP